MTVKFLKNLKTYSSIALFVVLTACASSPRHVGPSDGVKVGEGSSLKNMVPASQLEQSATKQYNSMKQKASQKMPWRQKIILKLFV